jgi:hypothetical protein
LFNPNQPANFACGDECFATARRVVIWRLLDRFFSKHIMRLWGVEVENSSRKRTKLLETEVGFGVMLCAAAFRPRNITRVKVFWFAFAGLGD